MGDERDDREEVSIFIAPALSEAFANWIDCARSSGSGFVRMT